MTNLFKFLHKRRKFRHIVFGKAYNILSCVEIPIGKHVESLQMFYEKLKIEKHLRDDHFPKLHNQLLSMRLGRIFSELFRIFDHDSGRRIQVYLMNNVGTVFVLKGPIWSHFEALNIIIGIE